MAEPSTPSASKEAPSVQTSSDQSALFPIFKNGKWGYVTMEGKIAIPPKYYHAKRFSEGLALAGVGDMTNFTENAQASLHAMALAVASYLIDGKPVPAVSNMGFIDTAGKAVIPAGKFEMLDSFHDGLARAWLDRKIGFIDKTGNVVIPPAYVDAEDFHEGRAAVEIGGQWGYIDAKGDLAVKPAFDAVTRFSNGLALARKSGNWTAIDPAGKVKVKLPSTFVEPEYTGRHVPFSEGLERILIRDKKKEKKEGRNYLSFQFIGVDGKIMPGMQEGRIFNAHPFSEGLSAVGDYASGKWGFIDSAGKFVIAPQFAEVRDFSDGLAAFRLGGTWNPERHRYDNGKWGYLDKTGKIAIPAKYHEAINFMAGGASVTDEGKDAYIDKSGELIWSE